MALGYETSAAGSQQRKRGIVPSLAKGSSNYPFKAGSKVIGVVLDEVSIYPLSSFTKELGTRFATFKRILLLRGLARRDMRNQFYLDALITADLLKNLRLISRRFLFIAKTQWTRVRTYKSA